MSMESGAKDDGIYCCGLASKPRQQSSVIFVNKNENENGERRENNEFVNETKTKTKNDEN